MQKKAVIDQSACDGSPFCAVKRICPQQAVSLNDAAAQVDAAKCTGCRKCAPICPHHAVTLV